MNEKRIMVRTTQRRIDVIDALAEIEHLDRDTAINTALYEWAKGRIDGCMVERLKMLFSDCEEHSSL